MENDIKDEKKQRSTHIHFKGGVSMGIGSFNLVRATEIWHSCKNITNSHFSISVISFEDIL